MKKLCEGLKVNTTLASLNLQSEEVKNGQDDIEIIDCVLTGNWIGDDGVKELSQLLKKNTTLTVLCLSGKRIEEYEEKEKEYKSLLHE